MAIETLDVEGLLEERSVPGLSAAYCRDTSTDEPTTMVWGTRRPGEGSPPVATDTIFAAGSISKPITAYAALRLAADGDLDLDMDVNSILAPWSLPRADRWSPRVTTRMLLSHVGGLSGWGDTPEGDPSGATTVLDVLDGMGQWAALSFQTIPNVVWQYSAGGYLVVQAVIERVCQWPM